MRGGRIENWIQVYFGDEFLESLSGYSSDSREVGLARDVNDQLKQVK